MRYIRCDRCRVETSICNTLTLGDNTIVTQFKLCPGCHAGMERVVRTFVDGYNKKDSRAEGEKHTSPDMRIPRSDNPYSAPDIKLAASDGAPNIDWAQTSDPLLPPEPAPMPEAAHVSPDMRMSVATAKYDYSKWLPQASDDKPIDSRWYSGEYRP